MAVPQVVVGDSTTTVVITAAWHPTSADETQARDLTLSYVDVWDPPLIPPAPFYRKPALSRISAMRSCSAVGRRPASGSCPSSRTVVSARPGMRGA